MKKFELHDQALIDDNFTDNGFWTPQTSMLKAIKYWVDQAPFEPKSALSIDVNKTLEHILIQRWPALKIHLAVYPQCDVHDLSGFYYDQFDLVFSNQVLEHLPKPWVAAKEMVRVLKPGGIGLHTSCAFNPRHGFPDFGDYYRFLPDGLAEIFENVNVLVKGGWGNKDALLYNLAIDDGYGILGGRRFNQEIGKRNDDIYPWVVWIIFEKNR